MDNERKKLKFEVFLERYFTNFGRVLLTNVLFAIPSITLFALFYLLSNLLFHGMNVAFMMLSLIPVYPFYAGVVKVVRDIARGDQEVKVCSGFIAAVRDNFLIFLLHGAVICLATLFSYFSVTFYIGLLSVSWVMYAVLFLCILIVVLVLFASYYLPLMTVTYNIKLRYLYKNCFLMAFGEFKNNFFGTLALAVVLAICFTATAFSPSVPVLLLILGLLWTLFIPATATFAFVFFIYDGMVSMIRSKDQSAPAADKSPVEMSAAEKLLESISEDDFSDIDVTKLKDTDDFIYHNGRMVKQSTLLRMVKEQQSREEEIRHE